MPTPPSTQAPQLGDLIFYIVDSKVHSAPLTSIMVVQNLHDDWAHTDQQRQTWQPFGPAVVRYATVHGMFDARHCFVTREALLASL